MGKYVLKRLFIMVIQLLGVVVFVFFILRLLPGDPAIVQAGPFASEEAIEITRKEMGLDKPLFEQFIAYMKQLTKGDLGESYVTGNDVADDLRIRFSATISLVIIATIGATLIAIPLGIFQALHPDSLFDRITNIYGLLAGSWPDFFVGLILIYLFFYLLGWAPPPDGKMSPLIFPPKFITGSYLVDGLITGNFEAARSAASHLVLPSIALIISYCGVIMKMMRTTMIHVLESDFIRYANLIGLPKKVVRNYAIRNALSPVISLIGIRIGVMIGGTVLIEQVFSLGGLGQYAVQSASMSDYNALTGFLIVACIITLVSLLAVDLIQASVDPRIRY